MRYTSAFDLLKSDSISSAWTVIKMFLFVVNI